MGKAKSYAERLFLFTSIGPLGDAAAASAIVHPIEAEECAIASDAVAKILALTEGYPYFLQEWGKQCWDAADACPITAADVDLAHPTAIAALDDSFFRVRFDRAHAVGEALPAGHGGPGGGALCLDGHRRSYWPQAFQLRTRARASLIVKGMIYTPGYGETAVTVPMFGAFMRRAMPLGGAAAGQGQ